VKKGSSLFVVLLTFVLLLSGCGKSAVLDPKGPVAEIQANVINFSTILMAVILLVVYILFVTMLVKYRATKANKDYEPPHVEGSKWLEFTWTAIPVIIVIILSVVTVRSTSAIEQPPAGYENEKPVVIYASSSNWKWHFSYPEEGIETVNYVNIPTHRPIEFRLYSFGPITSFWVPQLAGQKYAMSDMVNTLHLAAEHEGTFLGTNANFSGKGFAQMEFDVETMSTEAYDKWVQAVKAKEPKLTESEFQTLLDTDHVGRKTYASTHLEFRPAPEGANAGHNHGGSDSDQDMHDMKDMKEMDHSGHSTSNK